MAAQKSLVASVTFWADISYRMLRVRTVLVMITFEAIGYQSITPTKSFSLDFFIVAAMLGILYVSATSFNDVADEEVDKINLANDASRPLVTTNTTSKQIKNLGIISLAVASLLALLVSPSYLLIVLAGIILSIFYSLPPFKISHRGIFAALWLPLSYVVLPFLAGSYLQGQLDAFSIEVLVSMYVCFVGRILLKDFRDYEGDKKFGKLNFLVRHGPRATCAASATAWIIGDIFFVVTLSRTFPVLAVLIQPIIIAILYILYRLANETNYSQKLLEVLFIGRLGNAIALGILAALTLQAFDYSDMQKNMTVILICVFMAFTAIGLWRDSVLREELNTKS
jgi:4-hydroxybenzoate polyprenyltransferase